MSENLIQLSGTHPLQLDFFQLGSLHGSRSGVLHRKTTPFSSLLSVVQGYYIIEFKGQRVRIDPGELAYIPANVETRYRHHDGQDGVMEARWLHFRFSYQSMFDYLSFFDVPCRMPDTVSQELARLLSDALSLGEQGSNLERIATLHGIAGQILRRLVEISERNAKADQVLEQTRLQPVLTYIRNQLPSTITVEDLARVAALSVSRLHTVFNEDFGCSPMRFVKMQRLEMASRILATQNLKLEAVAELTGFADAFHLSHVFKAHFGIAPRDYRKQASFSA